MPAILRIPSFIGGMNTNSSPNQIGRSQSVMLRNMSTKGNRVITIPGFTSIDGSGLTGKPQGGASNGNKIARIINNTLSVYDRDTGLTANFPDAVGVGLSGRKSIREDYNVLFYKEWIIITNSLKSGSSTLNDEGEEPRAYKYNPETNTIIVEPILGFNNTYSPTVSLVWNGILFFAGGPENKTWRNIIRWGGIELTNIVVDGVTISKNYLFDFVKTLSSAYGVAPNWNPGFETIGDGEPINALFIKGTGIYIGTRNTIYSGTLSLPADIAGSTLKSDPVFDKKKVTSTGIKNNECVQDINSNTIYFDGVHIRRLEYEVTTDNLFDRHLSEPIQSFIECLPSDQRFATSCYSYPYYKLFLRKDFNSQENDVAIIFNVESNAFSIQDELSVSHAWTGYDENSNRWNGYWQTGYNDTLIQDNLGVSWNGLDRTFEWIGAGLDFGDSVRSKDITNIQYQISADDEIKAEHYTNVFRASPSTGCVTKTECNYRCFQGCKKEQNKGTGTGSYGGYTYGEYLIDSCKNMTTKIIKVPCRINCQYIQERIIGRGFGNFSIEYVDILYNLKNT